VESALSWRFPSEQLREINRFAKRSVFCSSLFAIFNDFGRAENALDKAAPKWRHITMADVMEESRTRITARVSDRVRDTLEQAAELLGATVNQFVVQTAYVEAQRVIERESVIRLSQKDAHKVLALLDNPPKPNKRLKDAVKVFKDTVRA
jgi:uncharacterized protein (DUF1778 family)